MQAPPQAPHPPPPPPQVTATTSCPDLPQPADDRWETLIANHDAVAELYHGCRATAQRQGAAMEEWADTAWAWYCRAIERLGMDCGRDRERSGQGGGG